MSFYSGAKFCLAWLIRAIFAVKIRGRENEPKDGTFLICANHLSEIDPVILGASLKHNPKFMAKKELMKVPVLNVLIKALGAYPIDRGGRDVGAIKKTVDYLKDGTSVLMFPQGTRHKGVHPKTTRAKYGCAMISVKAQTPVLPVLIKTKGFKLYPFKRVEVIIGKPIPYEEIAAVSPDKEDFRAGAEYIFKHIVELDPDINDGDGEK